MKKKYYTSKEVAELLNRSQHTVCGWLRNRGTNAIRVKGIRGGRNGGVYLVPARDVVMFEEAIIIKSMLPKRESLVALELYEERLYNELCAIEEIKKLIRDMEL